MAWQARDFDAGVTIGTRFSDTVGVGIGYTWYDIDFREDAGRSDYNIKYKHDGFEAYLNFRF